MKFPHGDTLSLQGDFQSTEAPTKDSQGYQEDAISGKATRSRRRPEIPKRRQICSEYQVHARRTMGVQARSRIHMDEVDAVG